MKNFGGPTRGIGRILVLTLAVLGWQLTCLPAAAQLEGDQAVFIDFNGDLCGIISATTMSVVENSEFACGPGAEAIDVTSDGTRAVIGTCGYPSTLSLVDLTATPPMVTETIEAGVGCVQELDIAPDDSFGLAPGSFDGFVAKFTLEPFEIIGINNGYTDDAPSYSASTQDVHIMSDNETAVQPMFSKNFLAVVSVTGTEPVLVNTIETTSPPDGPIKGHQGISVSEADNDTVLATGASGWSVEFGSYEVHEVTVASLSSLAEITVLPTTGLPESVDIKCDGSRAVVETVEGLMWLDMTTSPPSIKNNYFGPARTDRFSTSSVAFSADGTLLFVAGYLGWPDVWFGEEESQIDVYDATKDPPVLIDSITSFPVGSKIMNVATLPCPTAPSQIEVAVDIKPRSCPNPLNVRSRGVLPVAILGSEDFDVRDIDPATIQLEGVSPRHWKVRDVATPYDADTMQEDCLNCTKKGRDGYPDLTLKFKTRDIVKAIGPVRDLKHGECLVLTLTGELLDGTPVWGDDVVRIKKKKKKYSKKLIRKWLFSLLKEIKKGKKGKSCYIEKKKTSDISKVKSKMKGKSHYIEKKKKHFISKAKSKWHRKYKRH